MDTLFDESEPAFRRAPARTQWVEAYAAELREHPPVASAAGDTDKADLARKRYAAADIARAEAAARRLGCRIQLVPVQVENQ